MKSIYIFGSFNPFAYLPGGKAEWGAVFEVKKHINQKSLFAFTDRSVPVPPGKIRAKNSWTAGQLQDDFSKSYVAQLLDDPADFLLIDALSCVIPVREVSLGESRTKITYSEPMAEACAALASECGLKILPRGAAMTEADIRGCLETFCRKISAVYGRRVIVHEANYPAQYLSGGETVRYTSASVKARSGNKALLDTVYRLLKEYLPEAAFIPMPESAFSGSAKQAFRFGAEYAGYLYTSLLLLADPKRAQRRIAEEYAAFFADRHPAAPEGREIFANVQTVIDEYEYRLELYNQSFREYEKKFLELYNEIMGTDYIAMPWPENELTFSEFVDLKKKYPLEYRKKHTKAWYIFVYPWTQLGAFFAAVRRCGFAAAVRKGKKKLSAILRGD